MLASKRRGRTDSTRSCSLLPGMDPGGGTSPQGSTATRVVRPVGAGDGQCVCCAGNRLRAGHACRTGARGEGLYALSGNTRCVRAGGDSSEKGGTGCQVVAGPAWLDDGFMLPG